jgi:hypothetical protein
MADKKKLEYVISACGMMGVFTPDHEAPWYPTYKTATLSLMGSLKKRISETCTNTKPLVSTLYNAYTEKNHVKEFKGLENLGSDAVYADSGGLQIVTAGKSITEDIKKEIYKTQAYADYAMCFDVIPLSSVSLTRTRNERSNIGNKIFHSVNHQESAFATGDNIKAQATYFRSIGAKTKVIIIVQGNNTADMVDFYRNIESRLSPEDYENIGGMAIADTCMGNGELESIEMLRAAKLIADFCHPNIRRHLHVLGVGSISRMRPILYLLKSGYLHEFDRVSYDSSSHTSTFQYGLLKLDGTCKSIGSYKTPAVDKHFRNVYRLFNDTFSDYVTEDEFINNVFGDGMGDWKYSTIKNRVLATDDPFTISSTLLCNAAHTYFQIHNFVTNLDKVMTDEYKVFSKNPSAKQMAMNRLLSITDEHEMLMWLKDHTKDVVSKRIEADRDKVSLEEFLI